MNTVIVVRNGTISEDRKTGELKRSNVTHYAYLGHHQTLCSVSFKDRSSWFEANDSDVRCPRCQSVYQKRGLVRQAYLGGFSLLNPRKVAECESYTVWLDDDNRTVTVGSLCFSKEEKSIEKTWLSLREKLRKLKE